MLEKSVLEWLEQKIMVTPSLLIRYVIVVFLYFSYALQADKHYNLLKNLYLEDFCWLMGSVIDFSKENATLLTITL